MPEEKEKNMSQHRKKIICNQCGKEICQEGEDRCDFLEIEKRWGYFSNKKDGQIHRIALCESCYEQWISGFAIPPEQEEITEYM